MSLDLFDAYDLKARLSVGIILISPILLSLYLQLEVFRSLSTTVVVAIILIALSNLLIIVTRYCGKNVYSKNSIMIQYLLPSDNHIDKATKERFYRFLSRQNSSFLILSEQKNNNQITKEYALACSSAINWLKEHTRDSKIINNENAMYGFCRNMYGVKKVGFTIAIILFLCHIIQFVFFFQSSLKNITPEYLVSLSINFIYLFIWIFVIRKKLVEFSANNYAESLIKAVDKFC